MKCKTDMIATPFKSRGFNLLELMITLAVAVIFVTIALPSFSGILQSVRLKTQIYDFNGALDFARSEAVKRGKWVTVCASAAQAACGPNGTQWENGWIVFVDTNNNHTFVAGEDLLRATSALISTYTLRATAATTLATTNASYGYITFNAKGAPSASGQFVLCQNGLINPSQAVLIGTSGRITAAQVLHNGVPMDSSGADMTNANCKS
jgi:type IV fimbrial biogenesis protein FimT